MRSKDEVKGKAKQIKGAIKTKIGEMTNNPSLEAEGKSERLKGKIQEKVAKGRRRVGEAVENAGRAVAGKRR